MKKLLFIAVIAFVFVLESQAQTFKYKVITSVESIVPMGIGRSRLIEQQDTINAEEFTTERTDGKKSKQGDVKRSDAKVDKFSETKLLNFYSMTGINFQNIASNDALTSSKINQLSADGWELVFVTSGVESDSGKGDRNGIYITRYIFKRAN
ncbi:hypothetical protein BZG02_16680 [Labilibaculum filiforme]|uniref:DUF4177 domain-containing protein n=1 Tax=Labilibaculum filiforme TaxID=1940526 RepID=A0A2N3HT85_9BACT|nr:hypothetical protein [Labilibaculum filiforme]PKQ61268.1 hypothetical protein BZG02_16680 [Labilibaculum filiforme]